MGKAGSLSQVIRLLLGLCLVLILASSRAGADQALTIAVEEGQSVRDIAAAHLGDADLWEEVLRENGIATITEIRPGMKLRIPSARIFEANRALATALEAIQRATGEGAGLFAPEEIERAVRAYDQAASHRGVGAWEAAKQSAEEAATRAAEASALSAALRDAAAEARLSDREGWVEGQKPQGSGLVRSAVERHPDRVGEGPHAVPLFGADHLSRQRPPASQRQFPGDHPQNAGSTGSAGARRRRSA